MTTRPPLRLLAAELEHATRPISEGRAVRSWPRVQHPAVVRAWLGDDAVVTAGEVAYVDPAGEVDSYDRVRWPIREHGTLADPEAAGWALAAAQHLLREPGHAEVLTGAWADDAPDDACRAAVAAICGGVIDER